MKYVHFTIAIAFEAHNSVYHLSLQEAELHIFYLLKYFCLEDELCVTP